MPRKCSGFRKTKALQVYVAAVFCALVCSICAEPNARPNIVLILADDLGFSDVGCYGSEISTPNLDNLAANGLRFSQFYNCSRCCPTRASLLTGLYPHAAGVGHMMQDLHADGYRGELNNKCVTLAEVLRAANYKTAMVGKWHVAHVNFTGKAQLNRENKDPYWDDKHDWPLQRGFEKYFGTIHGVCSYYDPFSLVEGNTPVRAPTNFYYTDAISERATRYISEFATNANPFFLYVAYTAPHWPLQAPAEEIRKYRERYKVGWDELRQRRYDQLKKLGIVDPHSPIAPRDPAVPRWEDVKDKDWEANRMATYAAMIDKMDQGIGKILGTLKKQHVDKNTVVIFLSDNGGCAENLQRDWYDIPTKTRDGRVVHIGNTHRDVLAGNEDVWQSYGPPWANVSNTPFRLYKHWVHEGGIAAPFIVSWPGHVEKPGSITPVIAHVIDLMPTFMEIGHARYPATYGDQKIKQWAGKSLVPVLKNQTTQFERSLFWEHEGNRAVRQENWKLVAKNGRPWELYNMAVDRTESVDLAAKFPDRIRVLSGQYNNWATANGALAWDQVRQGASHKQ
jgi:arylsulfatase A-like enzyme